METLMIQGLFKKYGDNEVLKGINLKVNEGEFVSLLGPSGCGKTTMLRIIAGLLDASDGVVLVNGSDIQNVPTHRRNNGMVFQNYALFPHMTVAQNVGYGLKQHKVPKQLLQQQVEEGLKLVHMEELGNRYPKELSGGQQQRVALARALVLKPTLLLLDEPLSNLDAKLREEMQIEIRSIQKKLNVTTIFVTHDQREALTMSDKIAVMNKGLIEQYGTPEELYENPATRFVAGFIGTSNFISGTVTDCTGKYPLADTNYGTIHLPQDIAVKPGESITCSLRPERAKLRTEKDENRNAAACQITQRVYVGTLVQFTVQLDCGDSALLSVPALDKASALRVGDTAFVQWYPDDARCIQVESVC